MPEQANDTVGQYAALTERVGLLEQPRRVLHVTGDQPGEMLQGLLTNDVSRLEPGQALYSFMLEPKGRPVAELRLLREGDGFWIDLPSVCAEGALAHFKKYVPPIFARFETTDWGRLDLAGPEASAVLDAWAPELDGSKLAPLDFAWLERTGSPVMVVRREVVEGPGFDLYTEAVGPLATELLPHVTALGGARIGAHVAEIHRVERGVPLYGSDFALENLPQETGQEQRAISFDKGCYTGQEVVARIHYRGHVNRRLMGLRSELPLSAGQPLYAGERERGTVGTAVVSPRLGPIALGLIRRELDEGAYVSATPEGPDIARITSLPFASTGEAAHST